MDLIPVFRPYWTEDDVQAVSDVIRSGWWGMGPQVEALEDEFAAYVGARHAVAVNSCTAALHLALIVAGVGPGDEVILPALTFVSTAHAIRYVGATPVFADVEKDTLCIDPDDVERKITRRTQAIIPVDYGGHPADLGALHDPVHMNALIVIEDAAHAAGASFLGRKIGSISALTCFSFHAVKNMASGDGGMITTDDDDWSERLRRLRWCGIDKSTWERSEKRYRSGYTVTEVGYKCHMNDLTAVLARAQLKRLDETNARRRALATRYYQGLRGVDFPIVLPEVVTAQHNYVVRTDDAAGLVAHLAERGIATGHHYTPVDEFPLYAPYKADLPVTRRIAPRLVTLPLYPALTDVEQDRVIEAINEWARGRA